MAHAKILVNQRRNEPSWRNQLGHQAVGLLDTIPGVARRTAEMLVAEVGTDMTRFPHADHLASWTGVAPGNHERAGKRTSSKTRKGTRFSRTTLVQAAHAAARTKGTYLNAQCRRLATDVIP